MAHLDNFNFADGKTLLIDKPLTWTSFDVIKKVRYLMGIKKVGHAGTLDPLATGLLIVCSGKHTKTIPSIQGAEKEYTGSFVLGATRPSYDKETEIDTTFETDHITPELIEETLPQFIGEISQVPPAHSAVKVNGKRAYTLARKGEVVEIKPKIVTIKEFEITKLDLPEVHFRVVCSKGTYIRSLANDFGRAINSGAYLSSLVRTRIGEHQLKDAWNLDELIEILKEHRESL